MNPEPLSPSLDDPLESARPASRWSIRSAGLCIALALLATANLQAEWSGIRFSAERVRIDAVEVLQVAGSIDPTGALQVRADSAGFDDRPERLRNLAVHCPLFPANDAGPCGGGTWQFELAGLLRDREYGQVSGLIEQVRTGEAGLRVESAMSIADWSARLAVEAVDEQWQLGLEWKGQALRTLPELRMAPAEAAWITRGSSEGNLRLIVEDGQSPALDFSMRMDDLSFDSPDGLYAGEGLLLESRGSARLGDDISGRLAGTLTGGELLLGDFYRDFSDAEMAFEALPSLAQSRLQLDKVLVTDRSVLEMRGSAKLGLGANAEPLSFTINSLELGFPGAYKRYFESVAAIFALDGLELTGGVSWSGDWAGGSFQSGELLLKDLTIVDVKRERFAVTGLDARMRPGDYEFDSNLTWRGLVVGPVNLGGAEVGLESAPGRFAISRPLELDVLGGQLALQELAIDLPGDFGNVERDLDFALRAEMRELDMERLTKAMDWPSFDGQISGVIPAVSLDDGVLSVDGQILFRVFDGEIALTDLRVERPFGVLPSLAANIDIHDLDLQQVTHTFSFGQIGGRLDGYVHDLRMLDWKPVAFDAWLGTPERQEKSNDISRQAVNHLTTIGGGAATTVLTGPIMRMFNNFAYRRLGLGCRLQNNVCDLRGISEDDTSVLIMEGAGIPKIMIKAFNRRLDFPQLVAGLTAVTGEDKVRVGD